MDLICAWCGCTHGSVESPGEAPGDVSHGICEACQKLLAHDVSTPLESFLDSLDVPVLVVDANYEARTANLLACEQLGLDRTQVVGERGGDLFGCVRANLPHGCGSQDHCSNCSIRQAVRDSATTGRALRVRTRLPDRGDGAPRLPVRISTIPSEGLLLLRIETD